MSGQVAQFIVRLYAGWDDTTHEGHQQAAEEAGLYDWYMTLPRTGVVKCTRRQAEFLLTEARYASEYNLSNRGDKNPYGNECPSASARRAAVRMVNVIERALHECTEE